jgi:hypothetical protein
MCWYNRAKYLKRALKFVLFMIYFREMIKIKKNIFGLNPLTTGHEGHFPSGRGLDLFFQSRVGSIQAVI